MQDPKYKKLRKELDNCNFTEYFNPDSQTLVEKVLKNYTDILITFTNLKKKMKEQNKTDNSGGYEHQFDLLNEKYGKVLEENERLKREYVEGNGNDSKIFEVEQKLKTCMMKYGKEIDELGRMNMEYENEIKQLNFDIMNLKEDNDRMRELQVKSRAENDRNYNELAELLEKKKKEMGRLEEENSKYRLQISSLERLYNQEKQTKTVMDSHNEHKETLAFQMLKQELADKEQKLERIQLECEEHRERNDKLEDQVQMLTEKNNKLRNQEDYAKNSYELENSAKNKYENMYADSQAKIEEFKNKIANLENKKDEAEEESDKLKEKMKELMNKNKILLGNVNQLQDQVSVLSNNFNAKVREMREAESQKSVMERKIKELEEYVEESEERANRKNDNIFDRNSEKIAQEYEKKLSIMEKQIQITQSEMKIIQENEHNILSEKSKLETDIKRMQLIISEGNKEIDLMQLQKENLMKENKELKSHLSSTQNEGYSNKSEAVRLKETIDQYEIYLQDIKNALKNEQNTNKVLAQKTLELEKEIDHERSRGKEVFEDNKNLKLQVTSLEKTKVELFEKYRGIHEERASKEDDRIESFKEYNKLLEENRNLLDTIRKKDAALSHLNQEFDNQENILDKKTEENSKLVEEIHRLEKQLSNHNRGLNEQEANLQGQQHHINNLQRELEKLERMYNTKIEEINKLEITLNRVNLDYQSEKNELTIVLQNNKQLEKACEKNELIIQDFDRKMKERLAELDEWRETASCCKIENENLVEVIRQEKEELMQLENIHNSLVDTSNQLYIESQQKSQQISELDSQIKVLLHKSNQHANVIRQNEKQLKSLGDELSRKEDENQRLIEDVNCYKTEVYSSRRSFTSSGDWKLIQEDKIQELEIECNEKKRECEGLKANLKRYEKLIEEQREKIFELEEQLHRNYSSTPIREIEKSSIISENWNTYNLNATESERSVELEKSDKFSKNSRMQGEIFENEKSIMSKHSQRLNQITEEYNQTLKVNKQKN